mgnify:CR=1 FL=1
MDQIKLNSHQLLPIKFIRNNYGLILFHSAGSGKTITSLSMAKQFPSHSIIIITTKSSVKNFQDDIIKINFDRDVQFYTYKKFITEYETRRFIMAELLDPSEIMFTPFEPKTQNRFIMYIEGIPAFTIKAMNRPSIQFGNAMNKLFIVLPMWLKNPYSSNS